MLGRDHTFTPVPRLSKQSERLKSALDETVVGGIRTNLPLHRRILGHPDFAAGRLSTRFLERL